MLILSQTNWINYIQSFQENDSSKTESNEKGFTENDTEKDDDDSIVERDGDSNLSNHSSPNKDPLPKYNDTEKNNDIKDNFDTNKYSDEKSDKKDNSKPNIKP